MQSSGPRYAGSARGLGGRAEWRGPWIDAERRRNHPGRLIFPVIFSLIIQLPSVFVTLTADHRPESLNLAPIEFWPSFVLAVIGPLALLLSRRFPGPIVAFVAAAATADLFVAGPNNAPVYVALAFAIVRAISRGARVWAWVSVGAAWIISLVISLVLGSDWTPFRIAATTLGILICIGIGESMRTRAERFAQIARIRTQRRQSEVQAERVRIARELHDVLAHSLSQINVQAGVGLHLMDSQPEKARDALANIKETSKSALDEVRSVLGVLRAEGGDEDAPLVPESDLSRLDWLAASVSTQGIEVTVTGRPANVPRPTQLAMFRIVQESLTNIVRHAKATTASVELSQEAGFYMVTVTDNGSALAPTGETEGRGLLGMRERAELLGGTLEAGPVPGGGFRVIARIPVRSEDAA
ncbi:MAG TPA: sensor histidine kinase [Galbitalea sp.]|jgi:signal transduction histidine kinase|nr:sensor histidine kinase [Galbitalea sp.]